MPSTKTLALASATSLALLANLPIAHAAQRDTIVVPFLTGPQKGITDELALGYLQAQRDALGLKQADIASMLLKDDYVTAHNGIRHMYWRQQHNGIEVWNGDLAINVARDGSIINLHWHRWQQPDDPLGGGWHETATVFAHNGSCTRCNFAG